MRAIIIGSWTVRPALGEIEGPDGTVRVKPKSMDVFLALLRRPLQLCSREELLAEVWPDTFVGEEILTQAVAQLRRAFGDNPRAPSIIGTVPRRGYRLLLMPRTPAGLPDERGPDQCSPFVGRQREWEGLLGALDRTERGGGGVICLTGEPGIGKTRLAEEAWRAARDRRFLVLVGRCSEEADAPPLLPFVEIVEQAGRVVPAETFRTVLGDAGAVIAQVVLELRRAFPDLPPPVELPPEQQRRYLFNAFLEVLERGCAMGPICLGLDDLQWADDATALLLSHLAREAARLPMLIIGTFRNAEVVRESALQEVLAEFTRQRQATCFELQPLSPVEVGHFLERRSGSPPPEDVVDFFVRATDGNPFFLEELYGHVVERQGSGRPGTDGWRGLALSKIEVPAGVRAVVLQRVRRLAEEAGRMLVVAAVVSRRFDLRLVRRLTRQGDDERFLSAVAEAEYAGLLVPKSTARGLRYEFTHDIIRHALLADLAAIRRQELHLEIVEAMEALYPDAAAHAAEIVSHLEGAGDAADPAKILRYSMLAAERSLEAAASEDALRHIERALSRVTTQDRRTFARLLFLRGYTLRGLLRWEEAFRDWRAAIPLFEELGDREALARACKDMAIMAEWQYHWDEAIGLAERGLALVGEGPTQERANLLCQAGVAFAGSRRFEEGERILSEAEAIARQLEDPELLGAVLFYRSAEAYFQSRVEEQLALSRRSVELLRGTTNLWDFVPALVWVHMACFSLGRWQEMAALEPEIERLAERVGHVGTSLALHHTRAYRELLKAPDLEAFGTGAQARLEAATKAGFSWAKSLSLVELGQAAWWRGEIARAEAYFQKARSVESESHMSGTAPAAHLLLLGHRNDQQALELLAAHQDLLPKVGRPAGIGSWKLLLAAVETLVLLGRIDRAAALHPVVMHAMTFTGALLPIWSSTSLSRVAGISAAAAGLWEEASAHFDKASDECDRLPNLLERPVVLRWRAWMLTRRGRPRDIQQARKLLAQSRAELRGLGLAPRTISEAAPRQNL